MLQTRGSEVDDIKIQVSHPRLATDQALHDWLKYLEVRSDPSCALLNWSTITTKSLTRPSDLIISFMPCGAIEVTVKDQFSRVINFLNAKDDHERMQQLLDILVNCWSEPGIIGIDLMDIVSVLEASERGVITCIEDVKELLSYVDRWPDEVAPLLGGCMITSLQCIYRENEPTKDNFERYAFAVDSLADEEAVVVIGIIQAKTVEEKQNAVLYLGLS